MNEEEVKKQLSQMVSFILKEAEEKAGEIRVKAQEEFSIEKQRLGQAEKLRIMKEYERKEKNVEVQKKIAYSNHINQARLKSLKAREDNVNQLFAETHAKLDFISAAGEPYEQLLKNLIVQGLLKLEETDVRIRCREVDVNLVKKIFKEAERLYAQITGQEVSLSIDSQWLPPPRSAGGVQSCAGGIVLSAREGRILCDNTLDQRLRLIQEQRLPDIRMTLFGKSASRAFTS
eukprot:TRINITY_DN1193_c0_g1_i1.p1 TRINITY_DN1193_c0_g1~~TRINITY_DN1193_c0_g1_i1.p1  ORF type:complete len:262 (-),score=119.07 TRINITY_DN1193_c0_g1_i1:136-831(-)